MRVLTVEYRHIPVLLDDVKRLLALAPGETFCDCTIGGAGHSLALAQALLPDGLLIGVDQDAAAMATAESRLAAALPDLRFCVLDGNFSQLDELLLSVEIPGVDACLFDLGVSSYQLDTPERGFSYAKALESPLDMRMDPGHQTLTAARVINSFNEADLTRIIQEYGEERFAARIARRIVEERQQRPFTNAEQLVEVIREAIPAAARRSGGNPAKRCFQALRIAVNNELEVLKVGLEAALRWLLPGGRLVVISYHSLEDRIVKQAFRAAADAGNSLLPPMPISDPVMSVFEILTTKAVLPTEAERVNNPRSSSAKLRAIRKTNDTQ